MLLFFFSTTQRIKREQRGPKINQALRINKRISREIKTLFPFFNGQEQMTVAVPVQEDTTPKIVPSINYSFPRIAG